MSRPHDDPVIWVGSGLVPAGDATVSVYDHAFLYGDGVFETLRTTAGRIFHLEQHLDRLERSAAATALELPGGREGVRSAVLQTIAANGFADCFVKAIVTRGAGEEPILEHEGLESRLVVIARPSMPFLTPDEEQSGISAAVVGRQKTPMAALDPRIKSLNYLNIILSRIEARGLGARESILLDALGRVTEGSIYNVLVVRGREIVTPAEGCLEGITRDAVFTAARALGYEARLGDVYTPDLQTADEVLFTSTAVGVIAVTAVNGRPVGSGRAGPAWSELSGAYRGALVDPAETAAVPELVAALR